LEFLLVGEIGMDTIVLVSGGLFFLGTSLTLLTLETARLARTAQKFRNSQDVRPKTKQKLGKYQ